MKIKYSLSQKELIKKAWCLPDSNTIFEGWLTGVEPATS